VTDSPNHRGDTPASRPHAPDPGAADVLAGGLAGAARRAGLDRAAAGEPIRAHALLAAMGGVRGLVEALLPGIVFLVVFTATRDLLLSVIAPAILGVVFLVLRLIARSQTAPAIGGLVGIVLSALLALRSGDGKDFYLLGFWTNGVYGTVLLVSVLVGWPLLGLAIGALMGEGTAWRRQRAKYRALRLLTLIWVGFFALRLVVQLPLYFADNVEALGVTRLVMGTPLYGVLVVLSFLFVRAIYARDPNGPAGQH
jgi:hypothetical protein